MLDCQIPERPELLKEIEIDHSGCAEAEEGATEGTETVDDMDSLDFEGSERASRD